MRQIHLESGIELYTTKPLFSSVMNVVSHDENPSHTIKSNLIDEETFTIYLNVSEV